MIPSNPSAAENDRRLESLQVDSGGLTFDTVLAGREQGRPALPLRDPAGVLAATDLSDETMQATAEVGYSETAFLVDDTKRGAQRHTVCHFSPLPEVPFCGHATVAAVTLAERDGAGTLQFDTPVRGNPSGDHRR